MYEKLADALRLAAEILGRQELDDDDRTHDEVAQALEAAFKSGMSPDEAYFICLGAASRLDEVGASVVALSIAGQLNEGRRGQIVDELIYELAVEAEDGAPYKKALIKTYFELKAALRARPRRVLH